MPGTDVIPLDRTIDLNRNDLATGPEMGLADL
jgi:hypothetical protein